MEEYKRTFVWTGQIEVKIMISLRHEYIGFRGFIGNCFSSLRKQGFYFYVFFISYIPDLCIITISYISINFFKCQLNSN